MKWLSLPFLLASLAACSMAPMPAEDASAAAVPSPQAPVSKAPEPAAGSPVDTARPTTKARIDGYGDLRIGMGVDAARRAWRGELHGDDIMGDACGYLAPTWARSGAEFGLMFEGGRFVRYDVGTDREPAPGGGKVGMRSADIDRLYAGRVARQPHEYVRGGHYLRVADARDEAHVLVFETDEEGRVTRWRAGRVPQVDYVEGCS